MWPACVCLQICKDKDEAEVWFVGLKASVAGAQLRKSKFNNVRHERTVDIVSPALTRNSSPLTSPFGSTDNLQQVRVHGCPKLVVTYYI